MSGVQRARSTEAAAPLASEDALSCVALGKTSTRKSGGGREGGRHLGMRPLGAVQARWHHAGGIMQGAGHVG